MAAVYNVNLRTGCFCNIGACQHFLNLTSQQLKSNLKAGHVCGDGIDLIDGCPTGSARISFGYMSDFSDVQRFLGFIEECFVEKLGDVCSGAKVATVSNEKHVLKKIFIYPIKSCAAFEVQKWSMNEKGFCYDREWLIVNQAGSCISQKREPRLCLIKPTIDLLKNVMTVEAPGMPPFELGLDLAHTDDCTSLIIQPKICGTRVSGIDCGDEVSEWFTSFLKTKCRLLRQDPNVTRRGTSEACSEYALSLTNESQLLIITEASCLEFLFRFKESTSVQEGNNLTIQTLAQRFRPNLVINGVHPYEEDSWGTVVIGDHHFQCCGPCYRCQMICIDQNTGERSKEPLKTLAKIRRGKIPFGVHMVRMFSQAEVSLSVGDIVQLK